MLPDVNAKVAAPDVSQASQLATQQQKILAEKARTV
jgi:hypothetical protein